MIVGDDFSPKMEGYLEVFIPFLVPGFFTKSDSVVPILYSP